MPCRECYDHRLRIREFAGVAVTGINGEKCPVAAAAIEGIGTGIETHGIDFMAGVGADAGNVAGVRINGEKVAVAEPRAVADV